QRDALAQALRIVELAAHRLRGERRDLALAAGDVAELVDAFDGDQRRVHVHREELEIGEAPTLGDEREVDALLLAVRRDAIGRRRLADAPRVLGDLLHRGGAGEPRELLCLRGAHRGALDDEVHAASCRRMSFTACARSVQAGSLASTRKRSGPARRAALPFFCTKAMTLPPSIGGFLTNCSCTASCVASTRDTPSGRAARRTSWHWMSARAGSGSSPKRSTSSSRSASSSSCVAASASRL